MSAEIHVGDVGVEFLTTVKDQDGTVIDLTGAVTLQLLFRSPAGTVVAKTATVSGDPVNGQMQYTTTSTADLATAGSWQVQSYVLWGDGSQLHGNLYDFKVEPNLTVTP